ncbi:hypothetical protein ACSBR1_038664 [Camellia fascicularis]
MDLKLSIEISLSLLAIWKSKSKSKFISTIQIGFDRRLIPEDYLSFVSGSVDELGDFTAELKLSLFQLGISTQIAASILMQWMGRTKRKALLAALDKIKEDLKRSHLCTLLRKKMR